MNYKSSAELKALAREQLNGKYGEAVGVVFLVTLITYSISFIIGYFSNTNTVSSTIIYYLISFIISLLSVVLSTGLIKFFLKIVKNEEYKIGDMFWGFQNHPDKIILFTVILSLIFFVCLIPSAILFVWFTISKNPIIFVLAMAALIGGIVVIIIVELIFSQVLFILADNSDYSVLELMKESKNMMEGHKGRLFYLQISFLGWYALSLLSCGLALLWIKPYRLCTVAHFYMDIKKEEKTTIIDEWV